MSQLSLNFNEVLKNRVEILLERNDCEGALKDLLDHLLEEGYVKPFHIKQLMYDYRFIKAVSNIERRKLNGSKS